MTENTGSRFVAGSRRVCMAMCFLAVLFSDLLSAQVDVDRVLGLPAGGPQIQSDRTRAVNQLESQDAFLRRLFAYARFRAREGSPEYNAIVRAGLSKLDKPSDSDGTRTFRLEANEPAVTAERFDFSRLKYRIEALDRHPQLSASLLAIKDAAQLGTRVYNGSDVPDGVFRDAVALYRVSRPGFTSRLCSGVLVSAQAVLTAAHCICDLMIGDPPFSLPPSLTDDRDHSVVFGVSVYGLPDEKPLIKKSYDAAIKIGRTVLFDRNFCHDRAAGSMGRGKDIGLVFLDPERAKRLALFPRGQAWIPEPKLLPDGKATYAAPARVAVPNEFLSSDLRWLTVVGFGENNTSKEKIGIKQYAAVPIVSRICGWPNDPQDFSCVPGLETVLSGFQRDTCAGDSGGPAYVVSGQQYMLAAITSRAIDRDAACGPGGVYTLITPNIVSWMYAEGALP